MKRHALPRLSVLQVALLAVALLVVGCATTGQVDWNKRVGSFTYDQAIVELGPPDKQSKLSDGRTLAEWSSRSVGGSGSRSAPVAGGRALRLTFGMNGRLADWSN